MPGWVKAAEVSCTYLPDRWSGPDRVICAIRDSLSSANPDLGFGSGSGRYAAIWGGPCGKGRQRGSPDPDGGAEWLNTAPAERKLEQC